MNCYKCQFKGSVPGSAHSSCGLIKAMLKGMPDDKIASMEVMLMLGQAKLSSNDEDLIVLDPHGVKNGWADWPFDFDPVWVQKCEGFIEKEDS